GRGQRDADAGATEVEATLDEVFEVAAGRAEHVSDRDGGVRQAVRGLELGEPEAAAGGARTAGGARVLVEVALRRVVVRRVSEEELRAVLRPADGQGHGRVVRRRQREGAARVAAAALG